MADNSSDRLVFNGLNGATGGYLLAPMTPEELAPFVRTGALAEEPPNDLRARRTRLPEIQSPLPVDVQQSNDLAQAGWGILFPENTDPAVYDALWELRNHRRAQASTYYYYEYMGAEGYLPGESKAEWLGRHGAAPGEAHTPRRVPYYLLLVGSPEAIPFDFQVQLGVEYAVGRLCFDTPQEYARYARSVVASETGGVHLARRVHLFGTQNPDDAASAQSAEFLIKPLSERLAAYDGWETQTTLGVAAIKRRLLELVGGPDTPALLFTATHGVGFPKDDPHQVRHQGALLCQDWPGPDEWPYGLPVPHDYYLAGQDLSGDARLLGLISFHYASYSAGTPSRDDFAPLLAGTPGSFSVPGVAARSFVASLPQQMLSHPNGSVLAVVGLADRAWGFASRVASSLDQVQVFEDTLKALMRGQSVGSALESFQASYAALAAGLSEDASHDASDSVPPAALLAARWAAARDARSFIILGDPAARLPLAAKGLAAADRPVVHLQSRPVAASAATPPQTLPGADTTVSEAGFDLSAANVLDDTKNRLLSALKDFADRLGPALRQAVDQAATLEVTTYVSSDMTQVRYDENTGEFAGAYKRAITRIRFDGDTLVCVPEEGGEVDERLWTIHSEMVGRAQTARAELVRVIVSAAGELLNALKPPGS